MTIKQATESGLNFFKDVNKIRAIFNEFLENTQLNMYDIELLLIICSYEKIELRFIMQQQLIKTNQINKAVKKLFDLKMISKERLAQDERTVQLSIREDNKDKVEAILTEFANKVSIQSFDVIKN